MEEKKTAGDWETNDWKSRGNQCPQEPAIEAAGAMEAQRRAGASGFPSFPGTLHENNRKGGLVSVKEKPEGKEKRRKKEIIWNGKSDLEWKISCILLLNLLYCF